jgi:hypothetical protein
MLVIEDQQHFEAVVAFAKEAKLYEADHKGALKGRLDYLENYGGKHAHRTRVRLFRDRAPYSFGFIIEQKTADEWRPLFNGGLLFHGSHDRNGSGSGPTYACTLTPTTGWSIHT